MDLESRTFKLIIFSNPSNPTGKVLSKEQLRALANLADDHGCIIHRRLAPAPP
ncbi:aminotransferase class I/II-fold pyridoxal phosphate-dependent enzyme [Leptospira sp. 96542]|nr:aminotransferase class I/II-fold pyridoxal phosphate-dependent enzyme [Leptospira sp. 96542]